MKKAYCYFYYKLYKVALTGKIKSISHIWADIGLVVLEVWFFLSLYNYYCIYIDRYYYIELKSPIVIIYLASILSLNYFLFLYKEKWKGYVEEFDRWPRKKNIIGGIIVWTIVLLIIANLYFSFNLLSQIDWKQYR